MDKCHLCSLGLVEIEGLSCNITMDDFSQLASSDLPALGGSYENPTWNRSLLELKAASDSLWTGNSQNAESKTNGTSGSSSLLGMHRIPEIGRLAGSLDIDSSRSMRGQETDFLQWRQANRTREIGILKRVVNEADEKTRKRSQELAEKQLQEDWERTRDLWMKELVGTRSLGGSSAEPSTSNPLMLVDSASRTPLRLSTGEQHVQDHMAQQADSRVVKLHIDTVKRLREYGHNSVKALSDAASEIANRLGSSGSISSQTQTTCYVTALQLTSRILARNSLSSVEKALGILGHLSEQFETWIISRVRRGREGNQPPTANASNRYQNAKANTIALFVSIELGITNENSFWPAFYYGKA